MQTNETKIFKILILFIYFLIIETIEMFQLYIGKNHDVVFFGRFVHDIN